MTPQEPTYRILFAGTPDFAARHLKSLIDTKHEIVAVFTQPDRPAGRGKKLQASAVKTLALEHDYPVHQPTSLKSPEMESLIAELDIDIMVVVAYGLLLPKAILDIPRLGCINVHGSLLPKWRGAAPVQRSIWAGDKTTGITTMLMDEGLDTGDMLLKDEIHISEQDTSASLFEKLAVLGPQTLLKTIAQLESIAPEKQDDSQATYAKKLTKTEAEIDWTLDGEQILRNLRAFTPWPGTHFKVNGEAVKVMEASLLNESGEAKPGTILRASADGIVVATGTYPINMTTLQIPGKKAMPVASILQSKSQWFIEGALLTHESA